MKDTKPLTGEDMKALFLDPSVRILREEDDHLPSDMAFQHVAVVVNKLRRENRADHDARVAVIHEVLRAAVTLESFISEHPTCQLLPNVPHRDHPSGYFDIFANEERIFPLTLKRDLGKVRRSLERACAHLPFRNESESWHDYIAELEHAFKLAMRTTNGNKHYARSRGGPLPRFVSECTRLISGQAPSTEAVSKALKRKHPKLSDRGQKAG